MSSLFEIFRSKRSNTVVGDLTQLASNRRGLQKLKGDKKNSPETAKIDSLKNNKYFRVRIRKNEDIDFANVRLFRFVVDFYTFVTFLDSQKKSIYLSILLFFN